MSSTSSHNVPTDWEANERSSNDPRTLGPGDIIWAKFSIPRVIEKTNRRREHYEGNLTPEQAKEIGPMEVSPGSSRKRHSGLFIPQPQKSSSLDSDIPDDALRDRPCLVLFTCQRGSDVGYISAPLTQLKGLKPEQSTFRETPGFYKMIYPVSPQARFKIPAGPNGVSRPQKLLPIPGWETRSDHQYCTLGEPSKPTKGVSPPPPYEAATPTMSAPPPPLPINSTSSTDPLSSTPPSSSTSPTPYPLIRELIFVSLIVTPLVLLPYIPLRRKLSRLSRQVHELTKQHDITLRQSILTQDRDSMVLKRLKLDLGKYREEVRNEVRGVKDKSEGVVQEVGSLKADVHRLAKEVRKVGELAEKEQGYVRISPRTLEEIASSFVDIAAFVEEMETMEGLERRGLDPRGIEKMRRLAMNLHAAAQASAEVKWNPLNV
ncbi:hypothetical protein FS837_011431 [Tulasnella sp. UAMH 9824]|nr:hypothetical protein FS837_011431 [Tulasnella sp. UAMH 9824]